MKKILSLTLILSVFSLIYFQTSVFAEQSGSSPESGSTSRLTTLYDWLVAKGSNYGATDAADWTNNWGTNWNRISEAAAWEPDGSATPADVVSGRTFYSGNNNRTIRTGTAILFDSTNLGLQDYDDYRCSNNNYESTTPCAGGDAEYTGEEGTWTLTASGGTNASVTDNSITETLSSNKVYQDQRTGLYWTDRVNNSLDNEFSYVNGDDRTNPSGNSCNFNASGNANQYCDNQDPSNSYSEDNDVSANEFCLNLAVDANNGDSDTNGLTGVETDWRLPTQKELMLAYINGSGNNIPNADNQFWSSTEYSTLQPAVHYVSLIDGSTSGSFWKPSNYSVRCIRRG